MIKVNKKINLKQLDDELNANGLIASLNDNYEVIAVGLASNSTISEDDLAVGIEAHKAIDFNAEAEAAKAALLAKLGITEEEARLLLGGN